MSFAFLLKYAWKNYPFKVILYFIYSFILSACASFIPLLVQTLIDFAIEKENIKNIHEFGIKLIFVVFVLYFIYLLNLKNLNTLIQEIMCRFRKKICSSILLNPHIHSKKIETYEIIHHIFYNLTNLEADLSNLFRMILYNIFIVINIFIIIFIKNKTLFVSFSIIFMLPIFISLFIGHSLTKYNHNTLTHFNALNLLLNNIFYGLKILKIFSREKNELSKIDKSQNTYLQERKKLISVESMIKPLNYAAELLGIIIVIWVGSYYIINGVITPGLLMAFLMYAEILAEPSTEISDYIILYKSTKSILHRLDPLYKMCFTKNTSLFTNQKKLSVIQSISLKNVGFKYENMKESTFKNINFTAQKGDIIGILGKNGSGKTTLMNILMGFIKPIDGEILVNNQNLYTYYEKQMRSKISLMSQENFIFNDTFEYNITLGRKKISKNHFFEIIKQTQLENLLNKLPFGKNTILDSKTIHLSGGECQKISLARLLLSNADVIIFDEPCNHLDVHFMEKFKEIIRDLAKSKIIIIIEHRPHFLNNLASKTIKLT